MEQYVKEIFNDEILREALRFYDFREEEITNKAGFESFIFEINHEGNDYILRITHSSHQLEKFINAEIEFIHYLSDNHANVSTPIKSKFNRLVEKIEIDEESYFTTTVFTKALGEMVRPNRYSEELFERLGEAVANLHLLARDFNPVNRRLSYFEDPFILKAKDYIPKGKEYVIDKYNKILERLKNHPRNKDNYGLCHTDLHFGNMFVTDDLHITFFDFDDSMYAHYAFDIAIVFFYFIVFSFFNQPIEVKNENFKKYYNAFMKGYNKKYHISDEDLELVKEYITIRAYDLYAVYNRSFDIENDPRGQMIVSYFLDIIDNDKEVFDYSLIRNI